ncbi:MAG: hypothetical protein IRY94_17915 [Rhodospirillaceae bacterium]|nr:hypothetical protein [Rhodospirillaceae bacterium]
MSQDLPDEGMGDARPTPAEEAAAAHMLEILRNLPTIFADASTRFSVRGLSVRGTDGAELLALGEGGIEFGLSGLDTPRSGLRIAYRHLGLKGDWAGLDESETGAPDSKAQELIDALAPHDLVLDFRIEDLPGKELWQSFVDTVAAQQDLADVEGASALFGMSAVGALQKAGSKLRLVDSRLVSNSASLSLDGTFQADENAPMGATGGLTVEITGLDDVIALAKAHATGPDATEDTAPLELLRAFSERRTEDGGRVVDRYVLSLDPNGALLLNGKDFQFLLNALGETGGGPGQDLGPMPQEEPGPKEPEGEPLQ